MFWLMRNVISDLYLQTSVSPLIMVLERWDKFECTAYLAGFYFLFPPVDYSRHWQATGMSTTVDIGSERVKICFLLHSEINVPKVSPRGGGGSEAKRN